MNEIVPFEPLLKNGERLDQKSFHRRYQAMPPGFKAELVGGVVVVASPVRSPHGQYHGLVIEWLGRFSTATPGVLVHVDATTVLDELGEPQPDAALSLEAECGGRSTIDEDEYIVGPPELVFEVSHSSQTIDLHQKLRDYERAGVLEYVVVAIQDQAVYWFALADDAFQEQTPAEDGLLRSLTFPGLWLDAAALLQLNRRGVQQALERGLASQEHAAFVQRLEAMRRPSP
jgi:Uma2 family endonuclease